MPEEYIEKVKNIHSKGGFGSQGFVYLFISFYKVLVSTLYTNEDAHNVHF